jgi:NADPH2:quinone reductase
MNAWRVVRNGKPSKALEFIDVDTHEPGPGQVRVNATALNFNKVDGCYRRYKTPLPYTLGMEALGIVDATGPGSESWLGKRVT